MQDIDARRRRIELDLRILEGNVQGYIPLWRKLGKAVDPALEVPVNMNVAVAERLINEIEHLRSQLDAFEEILDQANTRKFHQEFIRKTKKRLAHSEDLLNKVIINNRRLRGRPIFTSP